VNAAILSFVRSVAMPFVWWFVVAPWEQSLRVRWGRRSTKLGPGIHFKIPFVDRVYVVSVRLRIVSDTGQTVMTRDAKPVSVSVAVQFSVRDVQQMFENVFNPEATVLTRVQSSIASAISELDSEHLTYEAVTSAAKVSIPYEWGLSDVDVRVTNFAIVRTMRLMMHEYRSLSGLDSSLQEQDKSGAAR
jgi:regulator of protease activity HflC (stomatin/prohibitin superfamily)